MASESQGKPPFAGSYPPPASSGGGGKGWMVVALLLGVLLSISFIFNLASLSSMLGSLGGTSPAMTRTEESPLQEVVIKSNKASDKIAVIEIMGVIANYGDGSGRSMVEGIKDQFERAAKDDDVKAVLLKVDSPGGEVMASDEIYKVIKDFQKKHGKPVVASMGSMAASGGYYVSAPCEWIVASELTMTGSIGVIMQGINYRGLMDKVGVEPLTFKSGKFKDMLSSTKKPEDISEEERKIVQDFINETYGRFKKVIADGRGYAKSQNGEQGHDLVEGWEDYADGRILSGTQALELGFVDELGDFDTAVARTLKKAGISKANLVQYQRLFEFSDFFRLLGEAPDTTKSVKLDLGINLPRIEAGKAYYLPSFLF